MTRHSPRKGLQHRNSAAFSFDEPQGPPGAKMEIPVKVVFAFMAVNQR
jgi:hypothetical protein